jgi:CheY-like chemotaxis protein
VVTRPSSLADHSPPMSSPTVLNEPPAGPNGGPLVLLVDDEPLVRIAVEMLLQSVGYRVLVATDGLDALRQYPSYRRQIALVITDMVMPNLDGPGLVKALKRLDPKLNIIGHSGSVRTGDIDDSCARQLFALLPKPCPNGEFLLAVAAGVDAGPHGIKQAVVPLPRRASTAEAPCSAPSCAGAQP